MAGIDRRTGASTGQPAWRWLGLLLIALGAARCAPAPTAWKPLFEETSANSLLTEAQQAAEHLGKARELMTSVPADADAELQGAEAALRRLLGYYLPLVDARERSYNAYRHYYLGDRVSATRQLDEIEKILVGMAHSGEHLARELERPLAALAATKGALAGDAGDAPTLLAELAANLNELVVKGGLVLQTRSPAAP